MFLRMMEGLAAASATPKTIMIDATHFKAHRSASSLRLKKGISGGPSVAPVGVPEVRCRGDDPVAGALGFVGMSHEAGAIAKLSNTAGWYGATFCARPKAA